MGSSRLRPYNAEMPDLSIPFIGFVFEEEYAKGENADSLSIPFIGFEVPDELINVLKVIPFNSLYWVRGGGGRRKKIETFVFQFPLLGSLCRFVKNVQNSSALSIPFIGFGEKQNEN